MYACNPLIPLGRILLFWYGKYFYHGLIADLEREGGTEILAVYGTAAAAEAHFHAVPGDAEGLCRRLVKPSNVDVYTAHRDQKTITAAQRRQERSVRNPSVVENRTRTQALGVVDTGKPVKPGRAGCIRECPIEFPEWKLRQPGEQFPKARMIAQRSQIAVVFVPALLRDSTRRRLVQALQSFLATAEQSVDAANVV